LIGKYVGETAPKTQAKISDAMGGVLFIDEAYSLGLYAKDLGAGPDGSGGRVDFGPEAIDALVKEMEDHRGEFVCIMAGYTREMEAMVSLNPGLRDRIGFRVEFPDYDANELYAIFKKMVEDRGYRLSLLAQELAYERIAELGRGKGYDFGNARLMRKIAERAIFKQNVRTTGDIVAREDMEAAFADDDLAELRDEPKWSIGFCA
jgi:AAA+ superfamily predicted ATPase